MSDPGGVTQITIVLPLPPRPLWPNARPHWATKARAVKRYRARAEIETLVAMRWARFDQPRWATARVTASYYFRDQRRRDRDNCLAALKAAFDGIADAGLVGNDAGLIHQPVAMNVDRLRPRVELLIERC